MIALVLLAGFAAQATAVPAQIQERTGHAINDAARPEALNSSRLPPGVSLDRPLAADDAAAIALTGG